MSLNYNGSIPKGIKYNNQDVKIVKYGNTAIWGKAYTLNITSDSNSSVVVSRTSSPNQKAEVTTLSNNSLIYYGDTLSISATPIADSELSYFLVNGENFTSGNSVTVTGNINVEVKSCEWKNVWNGSVSSDISSAIIEMNTNSSGMPNPIYSDPCIPINDETITNLLLSTQSSKLRITGTMGYTVSTKFNSSSSTTSQTYSISFSEILLNGVITGGGSVQLLGYGSRVGLYETISGILCTISSTSTSGTDSFQGDYTAISTPKSVTITKIEKYC